ncbi:MAG: hypothetical protein QXU69_04565, partial [Thermofilaceae archaeon]
MVQFRCKASFLRFMPQVRLQLRHPRGVAVDQVYDLRREVEICSLVPGYSSELQVGCVFGTPYWSTTGAYVAREDPEFPLRSKAMWRRGVHEYGRGKLAIGSLWWRFEADGSATAPALA